MSDQRPAGETGAERLLLLCTTDEAVLGGAEALAAVGYAPLQCATVKELQRELSDQVAAVVLDADLPKGQTFAIYRLLRAEGRVPFLVLLPPPAAEQPGWVLELEHGEQEDYARKPLSPAELTLRLNALLLRSGALIPSVGSVGMVHSVVQGAVAPSGYGKVICVFGAHGGVGKTTFAVHLAVGLHRFMEARVAFVDGDLWMGDSAVSLNLTMARTILDATTNGIPSDPEVWTRVLLDHPSGVKVLAPPAHLEDVERVPDGAVAAAAQALRRYFDYVVVDLDDTPNENTLSVLELADQIIVVLTPELGAVRSTLRLLSAGIQLGLNERVRLVLNRADSGLDLRQVNSVIARPIVATVPSDGRLFVNATNLGVTIFDVDPTGKTAARRALEALVRDVAEFGRTRPGQTRNGLMAARGLLNRARQ